MKKFREDDLKNAQNYSSGYRGRSKVDRSCWSPGREELCQGAGGQGRCDLGKEIVKVFGSRGAVQWGRGSQPAQCLFPKIPHRSKFLCVLLHLYTSALTASFVNAPVQHQCVIFWGWNKLQSLDPSVPLIWSPRALLLVALLLEASFLLLLTFYLATEKVGSIW